jgi:hypothetical protein
MLSLTAPACAQAEANYTAPRAFMDLFFDFTGSGEPDYPAGQPTLGQMLSQAAAAKEGKPGPLVLVEGSDIYVYDSVSGDRLGLQRFRADRTNGFYELTAISHLGPALAYLAQIKANGDARWKERLSSLRTHVAAVRALNLRRADNWLDRLDQPAWVPRKAAIRDMVDYACARTLAYIASLGDGEALITASVNDAFFNGTSSQFPVPFVNVMIGTFMLEGLRGRGRCTQGAQPPDARLAPRDGAGEQSCRQQCLVGPDRGDQLAGLLPESGFRIHLAG